MPWQKIGSTHRALLELSSNGRAIKEMLLNLIPQVFGQKRRHFAPLSYPGLLNLTFESHGQQPRPYEIIYR